MPKYEVQIACILRECMTVIVEADNQDDAKIAAYDVAILE